MCQWQKAIAILGSGGTVPGITFLNLDSGESRSAVSLPTGQSVYAIGLSPGGQTVAFGTKSGLIYRSQVIEESAESPGCLLEPLLQGSPVLAVCYLNDDRLVASDVAGRCLLWHLAESTPVPVPLETGQNRICSLLRFTSEILVGLAEEGELLFWNLTDDALTDRAAGPEPPAPAAAVCLLHWEEEETLVYPAQGGQLVRYFPLSGQFRSCKAHQEEFCAVALTQDRLVTAGWSDGRLCLWQPGSERPEQTLSLPVGVLSALPAAHSSSDLLLIDTAGRARVYSLDNGKATVRTTVTGEDYRAAVGPSARQLRFLIARRRQREAQQLSRQIQEGLRSDPDSDVRELYARLGELGFEHISLELQADQAHHQNDLPKEIALRRKLAELLPDNTSAAREILQRHATVLERVAQFREAASVYERLVEMNPSHPAKRRLRELSALFDRSEETEWIIDTDLPLEVLLQSANALGRPFRSRYLLERFEPLSRQGVSLEAGAIVRKQKQILRKQPEKDSLWVSKQTLWRLSAAEIEPVEVVLFSPRKQSGIEGTQLAVQIATDGSHSAAIPLSLFSARALDAQATNEDHNRRVLEAYRETRSKPHAAMWLKKAHETIVHTLRRILSERLNIESRRRK